MLAIGFVHKALSFFFNDHVILYNLAMAKDLNSFREMKVVNEETDESAEQ